MMKRKQNERGAVLVTFALLLLFFLGFMGIALDLGHLFVIRTELQTSMDACALAGAQELNGQTDARTRAINAGIAAGNANNVDLQSASWNGTTKVSAADITFLDKDRNPTSNDGLARYMKCAHTQDGTLTPLLSMIGSYASSSQKKASGFGVGAAALATTAPAQSACLLPLALVKDTTRISPSRPFGYDKGDWVPLLLDQASTSGGQIGWANLTGNNSGASDLTAQLQGYCGSRVDDNITNANANGAAGTKASLVEEWNGRFGIYKAADGYTSIAPDYTGYGYTSTDWKKKNASGNTCCAFDSANDGAGNKGFLLRRQSFDTCGGGSQSTIKACEGIMGMTISNNLKVVATGGSTGQLRQYGTNRRIAVVPVVAGALTSSTTKISDFACMFLLQPIPSPSSTNQVFLEYIGKASDVGSPCTAGGLPGASTSAGPLVPVLVR
jgi:Flp pilus assembly protein TadG